MKRQKIVSYSFISGFILMTLLVVIVLRSFMQKRRANRILASQKHEIEEKNVELIQQKDEIQIINDLISHRGPDDEGFYFEKNFSFGHRRSSILDLTSNGQQPMHYLDRYVITYNGEVYNYIEIREELLKEGYVFDSHTDTEVIIARE